MAIQYPVKVVQSERFGRNVVRRFHLVLGIAAIYNRPGISYFTNMILRIACFIGLTFAASMANCQPLQLRAGMNYSSIVDDSDTKFHAGFYAGIQKDLALSRERITFQPGIFYSLQTTQRLDYERFSFHYIQVPALFNFRIAEHGGLLAGPQVGLLLHATGKFLDGKSDPVPLTSDYSSVSLSLGVGPYAEIDDHFKIELRAMYDVLGLSRNGNASNMLLLQLGLVYAFTKTKAE